MAEERRREDWNHTAQLMALVANVGIVKKDRAFTPADFHPMSSPPLPPPKVPLTALKSVFVDRRPV